MNYFTSELWKNIHSDDIKVRESANNLWKKNIEIYNREFEKVKPLFSKKFLKSYSYNNHFHDWSIINISYCFSINDGHNKFIMELSHDSKNYLLIFYGVTEVKFDKKQTEYFPLFETDEYSYDEWELSENNLIIFRLLMLSFSTIELKCKGVIFKRKTSQSGDGSLIE